jgi:hypothetical protein
VSDRAARIAIACVVLALAAAVWRVRLPQFWGDGSTYYSMAWSLAEDGDLRYEARDLLRVQREMGMGPEGLFLKRTRGGLTFDRSEGFPWIHRVRVPENNQPLYFAKAFAYPLAAAPFVKAFGTRGLLLANVAFLGVALWLAYEELRRRAAPAWALALALVLFLATVTPLYLLWPAPEIFNVGVIAAGLVAWRRGHPLAAAVLLGIAIYSKPYNLWLAIPLGVAPLLGWAEREDRTAPAGLGRRLLESARRGVVLAATTIALFAANAAITGEVNYQGGERKTFYGDFPYERKGTRDVTFGNSGIWMSTNSAGPSVEGEAAPAERGAEPPRSAAEFRASFLRSLWTFWIGRFGGAAPYFLPFVVALVLFLARGPRDRFGWLAVAALGVSYLFYLRMIPDNWYGGSGTVGNRYFLNLLPLAVLLVPRGREAFVVAGGLAGLVFTGPLLLAPLTHSLRPGHHALSRTFRALPAELEMLNDLAVFAERWRWKKPYGDTEGDAHKNWPADPKAYYLYFPDDGTYGRESLGADEGFWLRGRETAEVFLRALEPVTSMRVRVTGGPAGDAVTLRVGGAPQDVTVGPGETRETSLSPGAPFVYKDSFVYVVRLRSRRAAPEPTPAARPLGSFVRIDLEVARRPRPGGG